TPDGLWTEEYFDGLGRPYYRLKKGGFAQWNYFNDDSARVWRQKAWAESGESLNPTTFTYDGLGRPCTIRNPDGTQRFLIYGNGFVTSVDERTHDKTQYKDAYGHVIQLSETNGPDTYNTYYRYSLAGDLLWITDPNGNQTDLIWNSLGQKTSG